jgi:hypothetical protein
MFKKNSWIVALLVALSFSIFFIGCIDPLVEAPPDKGTFTEVELTEFNAWGGNAENQAGWGTDGAKWDSGKKTVKPLGLTVEDFQKAKYLVVEVNDGFPKNGFETIWSSWDASGASIADWQQFSNITTGSGVLNPGFGTKEGNTLKLEMSKILKNYSTFQDSSTAAITLIIQHWGNGGTGACIKSAKLLISDEPTPHEDVTDITLPGDGGMFGYKLEFALSATVAPSFATNQKILWSIRKWVSEDGTKTIDLDADLSAYESFVARNELKGKVDFKTTYNENDDPVYGRNAIIATDGADSAGTVTLLATIKNAVYDADEDKYLDFTKEFTVSIIDVITYEVPAGGIGFFYVDLNDWRTTSPTGVHDNAAVLTDSKTDTHNISVKFTLEQQRVNFGFTDAQIAILKALGAGSVDIEIDGEVTAGTGDQFRYHLGDATAGGSWNSTGAAGGNAALSTILTATLTLGQNADKDPGYFILQHRVGDEVTIEIRSIKITFGPETISVDVDGTPQDVEVNGTGSNVPPILGTPVGDTGLLNGYTCELLGGYGNSYAIFKVDFGTDTLSDFATIEFDYKGIIGDVGYKKLRVYAFEAEKTGYFGTDGAGWIAIFDYETDGIGNDGKTLMSVSEDIIPTAAAAITTNEVWFIITIHAGGSDASGNTTFQISDIKFVK